MRVLSRILGIAVLLDTSLPSTTRSAQVVDTLTVGFSVPLGDLAWDGTTMWTCDRSSPIVRLDPTTGTILQTIRLRLPNVVDFGLEWDGKQLWVAALDGSADLYRLNPRNGSILGSIYLRNYPGGGSEVYAIARKDNEIWVLFGNGPDRYIGRVDPATGNVSNVLRRTEPDPFGLAWDGSAFVTCSYSAKMIYRIEPESGRILSQFPAPSEGGSSPTGLGWDGRYLWVSSYPQLYKIDLDGQPIEPLAIARTQSGPRYAGRGKDLDWDDGLCWYTEVYDKGIYLLDMGFPFRVVRHLTMSYSPTGIERIGSSLWTTYNGFVGGSLVELDVESGGILRQVPFPRGRVPLGMDFDGTDLWIVGASFDGDDVVYRVSPADGGILASLPTPGPEAAGVAWDGRSLWLTDQSTDLVYELDPASGAVLSQFGLPIGTAHGIAFDQRNNTFWLTDDGDRIYQLKRPSGATHLLDFHASDDDGGVVVHWQPTPTSTQQQFVLERGDAAGGPYADVATLDGTGASYAVRDAAVVPGHIYYYRLRAIGAAGTKVLGPLSVAYQYAYPPIATPVVVQGLRTVRFAEGIRIEWSIERTALLAIASVSVERAPEAVGPFIGIGTALAPEEDMSFEDRSVLSGSTVWYRLVLVAHSGARTLAGPVSASLQEWPAMRLDPPVVSAGGVEFRYAVGSARTSVHLAVYDSRGRSVRVLENAVRGPGERLVNWDGRDGSGRTTARGVYFVRLAASGATLSHRFVWIHR